MARTTTTILAITTTTNTTISYDQMHPFSALGSTASYLIHSSQHPPDDVSSSPFSRKEGLNLKSVDMIISEIYREI